MWQFAKSVEGIGVACRALDIPITGGNVSLYNETDGQAILPTPVIGVVGVLDQADRVLGRVFRAEGDVVVLLGEGRGELGGSEYLKTAHGAVFGRPPVLDLERERALQRLLVEAAAARVTRSAHDCAEGGLAITLAECCFDAGIGAEVSLPLSAGDTPAAFADLATLFGESASRVIVSTSPARAQDLVRMAAAVNVPAKLIGRTGGDRIRIVVEGRTLIDEPLGEAEQLWSTAIEKYFVRPRAIA